ncbi:MAG TPA: prolipoprotein diacylglyceryl transferase family protein [Gemmatimonadaceae bacterium]|nr:prolipoprotein diacylglyceryl transferase family protein [Gemmatimonadaceae bacterium]
MHFPVYIIIGRWSVHPHVVFELLGYLTGVALVLRLRRRHGDPLERSRRWSVGAAALIGGVVGSRILGWPDGKTIIGGLVGGLIAVELTKRILGLKTATGDLFAVPLSIGIAIGRVGCFLTGLSDNTHGNPTTRWTGVDFGDGVRRHPTQLYEAVFLIALAAMLTWMRSRLVKPGDQFRLFMVAYMVFRLVVDFIKPEPVLTLGLSAIQWACVATLAYYAPHVPRMLRAVVSGAAEGRPALER